jgi:hypothetical protein
VDTPLDGGRRTARQVYLVGVWLLVAAILIQVLLAGAGVFTGDANYFIWHANYNSLVVFLLPLILIGVGRYGRVPRQTLWLTAAVPGLVVVQSLLLIPYHLQAPGLLRALAGLHAVNALFIFLVAVRLLERVKGLTQSSG